MKASGMISVVIPTRNRGSSIEQTIRSVLSVDPQPLELIVADQSDPEQAELTREAVERSAASIGLSFGSEVADTAAADPPAVDPSAVDAPMVRYLRCTVGAPERDGIGAHRRVVKSSSTPTMTRRWRRTGFLPSRTSSLRTRRSSAVYGKILVPARPDTESSERSGTEVTRLGGRALYTEPTLPWYLGSGGNMAFKREELLKCGGFDEVMTIGGPLRSFEDLDLGHRLLSQRAGSVSFCPESVVYHHSTKSLADQVHTEVGYGVGAGAAFVKYRRCSDPLAWPLLFSWVWQMAIRRAGAALFRWRSISVLKLALVQLWAPFMGIAKSRGRPVDSEHCVFRPSANDRVADWG